MDSISYSVGILMGQNLKGFEGLDVKQIAKGLEDVLEGKSLQIDLEDAQKIYQNYAVEMKAKQNEALTKDGAEFLAKNAQRKEVTTLPSGLQYEVLKAGEGSKPTSSSKVTVHYVGTLINGEEFDSSVRRGQPATFGVTQVISGWTEALQLMPEGSKWKLFIPYNLGYGDRGAGQSIPPYATLIFEVELLKVN
ncbi:MAG: FKBP-type peptidyl-prolyl cis-trans isomerase [Chitinophagales bacterium]